MGHSTSSGRTSQADQTNGSRLPQSVEQNSSLTAATGLRITRVAQKAFDDTYSEARRYFRDMGERTGDENLSIMTRLEGGYVSLQTLKGVQALINSEQKNLDRQDRMGIANDGTRLRRLALNAVQRGLNSSYRQHRDYWDGNT